jgi:hypothetical protein
MIGSIVSGGQTGADRAALDAAIEAGMPYGGWCPLGGLAEDHPGPPGLLVQYPGLRESDSPDPVVRTELNVRDSDATLILVPGGNITSFGTALTEKFARQMDRPFALVDPDAGPDIALPAALALLDRVPEGGTLNVAGPRESQSPGVYESSLSLLLALLARH